MDNVFERRAGPSELGVRVWIDLSDDKKASFYFADRAGEHFLVRSMALPDARSPLALEALGQVLELSVRALLEDARVGMSRAEVNELLARETRRPKNHRHRRRTYPKRRKPRPIGRTAPRSGPKLSTARGCFRAKYHSFTDPASDSHGSPKARNDARPSG